MSQIRIRVSGLLVRKNKLLMVEHQKDAKSYYLLPGGGLDAHESIPEALRREFMEELGMQVEVGPLLLMAQSLAPDRSRNILHLVHRVESSEEPTDTGNDFRVHDFYWYCLKRTPRIIFYPDILAQLIELAQNSAYNGINVQIPEWLD